MSGYKQTCPHCGRVVSVYKNPFPTVDVIVWVEPDQVVLIERKNPPLGWALPGGFVDYGESIEQAALRELKEETNLEVELQGLVGVYSNPKRDPRFHTISTVFWAKPKNLNQIQAGDDAQKVRLFSLAKLPDLAFDHAQILQDFSGQCLKI